MSGHLAMDDKESEESKARRPLTKPTLLSASLYLKAKAEGSTRLAYTGLRGGLGHLKIETRLIDERL